MSAFVGPDKNVKALPFSHARRSARQAGLVARSRSKKDTQT